MSSIITPQSVLESLEVVLKIILQDEKIKICVKESVKGGFLTGFSTLVGGLLGGKIGLIAGGVVGTVAAGLMTKDFQSVSQVINEMDYEKQQKLFDTIQNVIPSFDVSDAIKLTDLLSTNPSIKQKVIQSTINFLCNEMSMEISGS